MHVFLTMLTAMVLSSIVGDAARDLWRNGREKTAVPLVAAWIAATWIAFLVFC